MGAMKVVDEYNVLEELKLFYSCFSKVHLRPHLYKYGFIKRVQLTRIALIGKYLYVLDKFVTSGGRAEFMVLNIILNISLGSFV